MDNFWIKHAKSIEEMKNEPIFDCFTQDALKRCNSKEDLFKEIKEFRNISPLEGIAKEYVLLSTYKKREEYGKIDMTLIGLQLSSRDFNNPACKKFIEDSNDLDGYFKKIISQESEEELNVYWAHVNKLRSKSK